MPRTRRYSEAPREWEQQPKSWTRRRSHSWDRLMYDCSSDGDSADDIVELTEESTRLVDDLIHGPGRVIPKLAAALARRK